MYVERTAYLNVRGIVMCLKSKFERKDKRKVQKRDCHIDRINKKICTIGLDLYFFVVKHTLHYYIISCTLYNIQLTFFTTRATTKAPMAIQVPPKGPAAMAEL